MIAMPKLIPTSEWNALSLAIARGDTAKVQYLVEENHLDVNAFLDSSSWMPVLMDALLTNGFDSEEERLPMLRYLLEKGANPNICCRRGYNCLHIAVQQERYVKALDLFLDYNADVNVPDADGTTILCAGIQGYLLRNDSASQTDFLRVLEKILWLGADLDQANRWGMCARGWLAYAPDNLKIRVASWEAGKPFVHPVTTVQPVFPVHLHYPELAQKIWNELVAGSGYGKEVDGAGLENGAAQGGQKGVAGKQGQGAHAMPGELLQAIERLRNEAQRTLDGHQQTLDRRHRKEHKRMAVKVRDGLLASGVFDRMEMDSIRLGTEQLMKGAKPYPGNDVYDNLVDRVCELYSRQETPQV